MIKNLLAYWGVAFLSLGFANMAQAQQAGEVHGHEVATHLPLNPDLLDFYKSNETEISSLQKRVKDKALGDGNRMDEFRKLRAKYPDHALHVASELMGDSSESISVFSVSLLGAAAVMSDHKMSPDHSLTPAEAYVMQRHQLAKTSLRKAQADNRRDVRERATQTLASLSDEIGLRNIVVGTTEGRYSELEAVNHLALANPNLGLKLIEPFLKSQSVDVQAVAVGWLANSPDFQNMVRDEYLLNSTAPIEVRIAAAEHLKLDPNVTTLLLGNSNIPPELFAIAFKHYVRDQVRPTLQERKGMQGILYSYETATKKEMNDLRVVLKSLEAANTP